MYDRHKVWIICSLLQREVHGLALAKCEQCEIKYMRSAELSILLLHNFQLCAGHRQRASPPFEKDSSVDESAVARQLKNKRLQPRKSECTQAPMRRSIWSKALPLHIA